MAEAVDITVDVETDTAWLYLFDPDLLGEYAYPDLDDYPPEVRGVHEGELCAFSPNADGVYRLRVTTGELSGFERDYAAREVELGLRVVSGSLMASGKGFDARDATGLSRIAPGRYCARVFHIVWTAAKPERVPDDPPADYVVCLSPRRERFVAPAELVVESLYVPGVPGMGEEIFLFPSDTRELNDDGD